MLTTQTSNLWWGVAALSHCNDSWPETLGTAGLHEPHVSTQCNDIFYKQITWSYHHIISYTHHSHSLQNTSWSRWDYLIWIKVRIKKTVEIFVKKSNQNILLAEWEGWGETMNLLHLFLVMVLSLPPVHTSSSLLKMAPFAQTPHQLLHLLHQA